MSDLSKQLREQLAGAIPSKDDDTHHTGARSEVTLKPAETDPASFEFTIYTDGKNPIALVYGNVVLPFHVVKATGDQVANYKRAYRKVAEIVKLVVRVARA